jgi:hypothetical protein
MPRAFLTVRYFVTVKKLNVVTNSPHSPECKSRGIGICYLNILTIAQWHPPMISSRTNMSQSSSLRMLGTARSSIPRWGFQLSYPNGEYSWPIQHDPCRLIVRAGRPTARRSRIHDFCRAFFVRRTVTMRPSKRRRRLKLG